jgi:hypothetical protein
MVAAASGHGEGSTTQPDCPAIDREFAFSGIAKLMRKALNPAE